MKSIINPLIYVEPSVRDYHGFNIEKIPHLCYSYYMNSEIRQEVDKLKELIINAIPVEQIYLFGSYAYGTPNKDSDLDFYVVLKDDVEMREIDAGLQIRFAIARSQAMGVDIVAKKKKDFLKRNYNFTLEQKVMREGIRIYG